MLFFWHLPTVADELGQAGIRLSAKGDTEVWFRTLQDGAVAVGLFNKNYHATRSTAPCPAWNTTDQGYPEACGGPGGDISCFSGLTLAAAQQACCTNALCAAVSYRASDGSGCYKTNTGCGIVHNPDFQGFAKPNFVPPQPAAVNITVTFADVGMPSKVGAVSGCRAAVLCELTFAVVTTGLPVSIFYFVL